jgi:DNA (cytosine-5)-methyltransferase 1
MLKLLDLFSGIGGFSLGLESTGGFETIAFVEKDDFCQKVLKKHWPNTTIEGDIRNVKGDKYEADIITGGFPCQPFSVAGKRKGTDDDRYLWDETIRVVRECKPKWFIGENVEGLININNGLVLRQVQTDLEKEGFEVQCLVIPASGIGAWHQRKRIWIIAHNISNSNSIGYRRGNFKRCSIQEWTFLSREQKRRKMGSKIKGCNEYVSNSASERTRKNNEGIRESSRGINGRKTTNVSNPNDRFSIGENKEIQTRRNTSSSSSSNGTKETWWQTQSRICGVPNGVSFELDKNRNNRIKSLGNSIVPHIVRELGLAILAAENNVNN